MGIYTPCNFCNWQRVQQDDPTKRLVPDTHGGRWPKGQAVVDKHGQKTGTWFAEVPAQCTGDHI